MNNYKSKGQELGPTLSQSSLDPRPSDLCIPMEGLVRDDRVG